MQLTQSCVLAGKINMCIFSPFQHIVQSSSEVARSRQSFSHSAIMENTSLVSDNVSHVQPTSSSTEGRLLAAVASQQNQSPPVMAQTSTDGMSLVRTRHRQQNISTRACDIIMESWWTGTTKQYRVHLDKWKNFATGRNENPVHPTVANVIDFLTHLYDI